MLLKASHIIKEAVDQGLLPGAQYGFVTLNYEEFGHCGYSQLVPEKVENSLDTLYDLASCSKVVATTTLTLKLIEDKLITLDTKVSDILTDFPLTDITIYNLLTHTSGLIGDDKAYKKCDGKQEIYDFIKNLEFHNKPNETVEYSDFGYILLGFIIEKIKNCTIEEYAEEVIFKPLSMHDTMYNPYLKGRVEDCAAAELTDNRGLIKGAVHDGKANCLKGLSGNAGVFSNVLDLSKFCRMILRQNGKVLKPETIEEFKKCYTSGYNLHRTLGWCIACDEYACGSKYSKHAIFHTGFSGTSIYIDFDRMCAIILLTNRIHPARQDVSVIAGLRNKFHDAVLEEFDNQ